MHINYENSIVADQVNFLRATAGFRQIHPEQIEAGLHGSAFVVAAYDQEKIVGMARLLWDGGVVASIHDILVLPEYQAHRIPNEMITQILDFLRKKLKPGFGIQVDVNAWNHQASFYEYLGFRVATQERRGTLMHICLTNEIELTDAMFKQCQPGRKEQ